MTSPDQPDSPARRDRVEHRMELTYELPASPEEVWDAIATAEGISAWMVPATLDPQVGGQVTFDLGDLTLTGVVTSSYGTGSDWENEFWAEMASGTAEIFDRLATYFAGTAHTDLGARR